MKKFKTILIGFGQIAQGISNDKKMRNFYQYQSHAQVLQKHPKIDWCAVVDPDPLKLKLAKEKWNIKELYKSINDIPENFKPDIAVLATKPDHRVKILQSLPTIRGAIIEKPLSYNFNDRNKLLKYCLQNKISTNVNFTRRFDLAMISLKKTLINKFGDLQYGSVLYGNGIRNNGVHFIDLIRMLFGEIKSVKVVSNEKNINFPIKDDINVDVFLELNNNAKILMSSLNFNFYREQYQDFWGSKARLEIFQEGLFYKLSKIRSHRAIENDKEISIDLSKIKSTKLGVSFYKLYDDLINSINYNLPSLS